MSKDNLKLNKIYSVVYKLGTRVKTAKLTFTGISPGGTLAVFGHRNPEEKTLGIPLANIQTAELVIFS